MASPGPLQKIFDDAKREFENGLPPGTRFQDLLTVTTIDQLYDVLDKVQGEQRRLRHLGRIQPFLDRLQSLAGVIEVFVQAQPEILSLVWGPIKLLLTLTTEWQQGYDAMIKTVERIGELLPQFQDVLEHFIDKKLIQDVLGLLYRDILDFYLGSLRFFTMRRRRIMFETLWPKQREKIKVVEGNIERHAKLLTDNITFEHIKREHEARIKSFVEFQEASSSRADQEFRALETAVCPRMYNDRLNWLTSRSCPGTAKWLESDENFRDWIDPSSRSTSLLWLHGIPGAGKTFLACLVVAQAKKKGRTLYAFPSHIHTNTTAISILHSLLFQAASDDRDLQAMLTDSNKQDLITDTSAAKDLLADVLTCVGDSFVVVDGLDEVDEFERRQLLRALIDILGTCRDSGLKICISSRAEDDIRRILHPMAKAVCVEASNRSGIDTYVNHRFYEWMATSEFHDQGKSEIRALLYRVCLKAKGMFLYARIVLDNVVDLINVDEIRRELRALPEDLDDAYGRIISRISQRSIRQQETVKRVLGWIGCSPVPLTIYELEQAILVSTEPDADAPTVDSSLNIVKLCGPIVEVVDERPQFVHSTVKEYIFHGRLNFLNLRDSTLDLLYFCVMYLRYDALSGDLDDEQLRDNLFAGKYRFQVFASSSWFDLARQYVRLAPDEEHVGTVNGLMEHMYDKLKNPNFQRDINPVEAFSERSFQQGRPPWPGAHNFISESVRFRFCRDYPKEPWTIDNAATWVHLDPLSVSSSCARVENLYNNLLHSAGGHSQHGESCPCPCSRLRRHYGARLYKCHYFTCPLRRHGLETLEECVKHMENHCRPWKCSVVGCDFTVIGFETSQRLQNHRWRLHKVVRENAFTQPSVMDDEALYPLLYELVDSGNVGELEAIWPTCRAMVNDATTAELVLMAAGQGSLAIVQLLLEWDDEKQEPQKTTVKLGSVVHDALQSGNQELARWILEKATVWGCQRAGRYREAVIAVLKSDSADIFEIWQDTITSAAPGSPFIMQELIEKTVLNTASRFPDQEVRMFEVWQKLFDMRRLRRSDLGRALTNVAQTTCSIEQARTLLKLGAPIDYPREPDRGRGYTALLWASKKTSEEAAHFMKFLLLQGADPDIRCGTATPSNEEGARQIETWLNMTWDQLVEWADQQRESGDSESE